jgi:hypothetical protein
MIVVLDRERERVEWQPQTPKRPDEDDGSVDEIEMPTDVTRN